MLMNKVRQAVLSAKDSMVLKVSVASKASMISSDSKEVKTHSEMCSSSSSHSSEEETNQENLHKPPRARISS